MMSSVRRVARSWPIGLWAAIMLTFALGAACGDVTNPRIPRNDDTTNTDSNLHGFLIPPTVSGGTLTG